MSTPSEFLNCPAPAKLNLFLHITGRRADGYHLLQSVFQLIDLADTLHFRLRQDGLIQHGNPIPGVPAESDLVIKAARLLHAEGKADAGLGVDVHVEKRIPMGGGLGGGSSDAATTLLVLNRLWRLNLPRTRLMQIGLRLGADVPFFIFGQNAFVEGIGEQMQALPLPQCHYAIIHPGVAVPTATVFTAPELTRDTKAIRIADFSGYQSNCESNSAGSDAAARSQAPDVQNKTVAGQCVQQFGRNDLEPVAVSRFAQVSQALAWLNQAENVLGANGKARMSGSGACVFRAFPENAVAAVSNALGNLPAAWQGWVCRSLAEHPLRAFASDQVTGASE